MTMTLRLSPDVEAALERIAAHEHLSKTAVIESAIVEKDARSTQVDRALAHVARITVRDAEILDRLADR